MRGWELQNIIWIPNWLQLHLLTSSGILRWHIPWAFTSSSFTLLVMPFFLVLPQFTILPVILPGRILCPSMTPNTELTLLIKQSSDYITLSSTSMFPPLASLSKDYVCFQCLAHNLEGTQDAWWVERNPRILGLGRAKEAHTCLQMQTETHLSKTEWLALVREDPYEKTDTEVSFPNKIHEDRTCVSSSLLQSGSPSRELRCLVYPQFCNFP